MTDSNDPSAPAPAIGARVKAAMAAHRAGRLGEAEAAYRAVLAEEPQNAEALHLVGLIAFQQGRAAQALPPVQQALACNPRLAPAHNTLGLVKAALGDPAGAEAAFREALTQRPNFAEASVNLGNLLLQRGERDGALDCFRGAVATNPNYAEAEGYLGLTLNELGRPGEALAHLERAVSLKPGHPELIGNLGVVLAALNRPEAEERFRQALAVQPNHGMALRNLGRLLAKLERHEEAVSWLERAVAVGPADARTLTGLGQALIELNRLDQAKAAYEKATAADPLYGGGWLGLGRVCRILGRFDEALGHALHWLALDPGSQEALTAVAESSRESLTPDAAMRLEQVLAGPGPSAAKRPPLHTALSRHYEASLAYDDAFRHMTAMNAIHSRELIETGARYDAEGQRRRGDRMISVCTPDLFRRLRDIGDPSPLPVFVVGLPRSGTTLCEQILSSHSQVHGAGELKAVRELARGLGDRLVAAGIVAGDYPEALADLSPAVARQAALEHLAFLRSLGPKATRVVDKMPFNFMNLGLIAVLFPNAKILHCRRNPADTALSCFQQNFAADMPWTVDLASLGHYYREYDRLMRHWKNVLPIPILDVVYEEEVADLETWARRLIAFCGLEWEDACLRFFETERAVKTASDWQVRQPLYATSVGRWRNYQRHLGPLFEALGDLHRE